MKAQLKQVLIAAAVLFAAAALLLIGYSWYTRPQSFSAIFPMSLEDVDSCCVDLHYFAEGGEDVSWELTPEQTDQLLERMADTKYRGRWTNLVMEPTGLQINMDASVRIRLSCDDNADHVELLLSGDALLVNPLLRTKDKPSRIYEPTAGAAHQEDILVLLESSRPDG